MRLMKNVLGSVLCSIVLISCVKETNNNGFKPHVAFCAEHEGGLYLLGFGSGELRHVDVGMSNIMNVTSAPYGQLIAFEGSCHPEQSPSLYILTLKNNKKELIYSVKDNAVPLYRPRFDSKGEYLFAVNYSEGIYRYSLSTRNWDKVKISGTDRLNPQGLAFSKSGQKVAISHGQFDGFLIADVNTDNIEFVVQKQVLSNFDSCISPQWIGDETLVFLGRKESGSQYIWKLDLLSGEITQITNCDVKCRDYLSLSKDERNIVFTGTDAHEWRLWQISIEGTDLKQLTKGGVLSGHLSPVWLE